MRRERPAGPSSDVFTEIARSGYYPDIVTAGLRDALAGEDVTMEASICKLMASEAAGRVADRAVQIFGGSGYVADYSCIERLYRDARLFRLYEGTSQIHQVHIAKRTFEREAAR